MGESKIETTGFVLYVSEVTFKDKQITFQQITNQMFISYRLVRFNCDQTKSVLIKRIVFITIYFYFALIYLI